MTSDLAIFAGRLREFISIAADEFSPAAGEMDSALQAHQDAEFNGLAMMLFALQFDHNPAYRKCCEARKVLPHTVVHWTEIPALPTAAFKELDVTCLPAAERATVFHSSGTTGQQPSRHFHSGESLAVYEASLWPWFGEHVVDCRLPIADCRLVILTPPPKQAAHSSLVHMFETIRQKLGASAAQPERRTPIRQWPLAEDPALPETGALPAGSDGQRQRADSKIGAPNGSFLGRVEADGSWTLDFDATLAALRDAAARQHPVILLGTAFSFVHLVDHLAGLGLRFSLPPDSRAMETGGYKGRSRSLSKAELHSLISERLGIPAENIVCEYGMSELSSQAYDIRVSGVKDQGPGGDGEHSTFNIQHSTPKEEPDSLKAGLQTPHASRFTPRAFRFPPWARALVVSPETGRAVADGETGLLRVFDLANVFSVMAIQTEDLAVRRGDGFELVGRAAQAEPRGCSLQSGGGGA